MSNLMQRVDEQNPLALKKILEAQESLPESPVEIYGLCKRVGVPAENRPDMPRSLSGFILKEDGAFRIFCNGNHPETRRRFTAAHELAHYLLHRDELGDKYPENILLRGGLPNKLEMEANRLAAEILMPNEAIDRYTADRDTLSIVKMARTFGVSPAAMSIRLGIPMDI